MTINGNMRNSLTYGNATSSKPPSPPTPHPIKVLSVQVKHLQDPNPYKTNDLT